MAASTIYYEDLMAGDDQYEIDVEDSQVSTSGTTAQQPADIIVNHTYNINYQTAGSREEDIYRDSELYGNEFVRCVNIRTLEITECDTTSPVSLHGEPQEAVEPELVVTFCYFYGDAGVKDGEKYVPDAKYKMSFKREIKGERVKLVDLHVDLPVFRETEVKHVALVGSNGGGKTVLLKRYARMVLNRQVPALQDVEVVHYLDVSHMYRRKKPISVSELLLDRMIVVNDDKVYKYGLKWMDSNREKILFIFDGVDDILQNFHDRVKRITWRSKATIEVVLENIITNNFLRGCRTLVSTREWAWMGLKGDQRPQRIVVMRQMNNENKTAVIKSLPGLRGDNISALLERCYPMTFHLSSDILYSYFAISAMINGNDYDRSPITTDIMLLTTTLQYFLRSKNSSQEIVERLPKLKTLCFDLTSQGIIRFSMRELLCHPDLSDDEMADFIVVAPKHRHGVCYRLMGCDYGYFFTSQVLQEFFTACYIAEMEMKEFEEFLSDQIHTDRWLVVRRFLCALLLNDKTRQNSTYFVEKRRHPQRMIAKLKLSLQQQAKQLDKLASFQRFELLASLYECGDSVDEIVKCHIKSIHLPDMVLGPSELHTISQIECHILEPHTVDICLGKDINFDEYDRLVSSLLRKCCDIRLNVARMDMSLNHAETIKNAMRCNPKGPIGQLHLLVNIHTPREIVQRFPHAERSSRSTVKIQVETITVPDDNSSDGTTNG